MSTLFLEVKIFRNHSLLSFSFPLLYLLSLTLLNSPGIPSLVSMAFLWDFDKNSMEILCNFYGVSMIFLWGFYWIP